VRFVAAGEKRTRGDARLPLGDYKSRKGERETERERERERGSATQAYDFAPVRNAKFLAAEGRRGGKHTLETIEGIVKWPAGKGRERRGGLLGTRLASFLLPTYPIRRGPPPWDPHLVTRNIV